MITAYFKEQEIEKGILIGQNTGFSQVMGQILEMVSLSPLYCHGLCVRTSCKFVKILTFI